jgi:hypothetical protein
MIKQITATTTIVPIGTISFSHAKSKRGRLISPALSGCAERLTVPPLGVLEHDPENRAKVIRKHVLGLRCRYSPKPPRCRPRDNRTKKIAIRLRLMPAKGYRKRLKSLPQLM